MTDKTRFIDILFTRMFSSFCFGGIFGCWLLFTILLGIQDGWKSVVASIVGYVVAFVLLMAAGWLLDLGSK